jgi:small redox-active disulfide protein 2
MKQIKVLGSGCRTCELTARLLEEEAQSLGVEVSVEKVTDMAEIMGYGVMSTPGIVVDGQLVHAGGMPKHDAVRGWLLAPPA